MKSSETKRSEELVIPGFRSNPRRRALHRLTAFLVLTAALTALVRFPEDRPKPAPAPPPGAAYRPDGGQALSPGGPLTPNALTGLNLGRFAGRPGPQNRRQGRGLRLPDGQTAADLERTYKRERNMRPDQALTIYEIRALTSEALDIFDRPGNIGRLGPALAGLHWEADFAFLFFLDEPGAEAAVFLQEYPDLDLRHIHHLTYAQWQDGAEARPFTVAGLTVAPAHHKVQEPEPGEPAPKHRLLIDPGLAFGFGGHPTTHSCLEFLARACEGRGLGGPPQTALDLGAGTGVLSLAAALWGVPQVTGVDYSHLAVEAARHNLALNRLENRVKFHRGPAQDFAAHPAELLLANIHLSLQQELVRLKAFHNRRLVVVSGLLPSEGDCLLEDLRGVGLQLVDQVRTDRWITMFCVNLQA